MLHFASSLFDVWLKCIFSISRTSVFIHGPQYHYNMYCDGISDNLLSKIKKLFYTGKVFYYMTYLSKLSMVYVVLFIITSLQYTTIVIIIVMSVL